MSTNTAGVLIDLAPYHRGGYSTQGIFGGAVTLPPAAVAALLNGDLYMNLHTAVNPGGEIRGQLAPMVLRVSMSGANEVPAIATSATGFGYVGLVGKQISLGLHYRDLAGPASNAHDHGPADVTVGGAPVLVGLAAATYAPGGAYNRTWDFLLGSQGVTDAQLPHFVDGLVYVNIHSSAFGGGEIRGQVLP